mgnify:CR=1 FL=1
MDEGRDDGCGLRVAATISAYLFGWQWTKEGMTGAGRRAAHRSSWASQGVAMDEGRDDGCGQRYLVGARHAVGLVAMDEGRDDGCGRRGRSTG